MPNTFTLDDLPDLAFDLSKCGGPVGVVPEPSAAVMEAWSAEINVIAIEGRLTLPPKATREEVAEAVAEQLRTVPELNARALAAYARLCGAKEVPNPSRAKTAPKTVWQGGCPTYDELEKLPHRARNAFFGWIAGQMQNPEPMPAATSS